MTMTGTAGLGGTWPQRLGEWLMLELQLLGLLPTRDGQRWLVHEYIIWRAGR